MRRLLYLFLFLLSSQSLSAQRRGRARLDCYRPPSYGSQIPVPRPGFVVGAGIQRPFLLSNATPLNGFRYAAKLLPQLRAEYRLMLRPWLGLAAGGQLYWEQYGLKINYEDQAYEKSYVHATIAKAGLSLLMSAAERLRLQAGVSFGFRDFYGTSSSGGALLNQNSRYANIRYNSVLPGYSSSTFFSVDAGMEVALSRRFSILLNGVCYLNRSLPISANLELYGQNGQESLQSSLDARQLGLGLSLLFRPGRLD